uniref:Uncharacterized protein n=1 Tax=Oryza glumipatula TaxID=40148 RepID=A0A0D9ZGM9_9ORYZ
MGRGSASDRPRISGPCSAARLAEDGPVQEEGRRQEDSEEEGPKEDKENKNEEKIIGEGPGGSSNKQQVRDEEEIDSAETGEKVHIPEYRKDDSEDSEGESGKKKKKKKVQKAAVAKRQSSRLIRDGVPVSLKARREYLRRTTFQLVFPAAVSNL